MKPLLTPDRFDRALTACSALFDVQPTLVRSSSRRPRPTAARLALYAVLYSTCEATLTEIGDLLDRDHSTVLHGIRIAAARAEADTDYQAALELIADALRV